MADDFSKMLDERIDNQRAIIAKAIAEQALFRQHRAEQTDISPLMKKQFDQLEAQIGPRIKALQNTLAELELTKKILELPDYRQPLSALVQHEAVLRNHMNILINQLGHDRANTLLQLIRKEIAERRGNEAQPANVKHSMRMPSLKDEIGDYRGLDKLEGNKEDPQVFSEKRLSVDGVKLLHDNPQYRHEQKVKDYVNKYRKKQPVTTEELADPQFFRKALVDLVQYLDGLPDLHSRLSEEEVAANPSKAAIGMRELLGPKGEALYKLALEEEANSKEYMEAAFKASTNDKKGAAWAERPIILVSGPSACGKTTAANAAVEKVEHFIPKREGDNSGNAITFIDGGILRETSQMRKLVVQCANRLGYSGVADLHAQSRVLDESRDRLRAAVFASPRLGAIIPETFSSFANPLVSSHKLLNESAKAQADSKWQDTPTRMVFCRVDGEEPSVFQKVVARMGGSRAWKAAGFAIQKVLGLNNTDIPESKSYSAGGFRFGFLGSLGAERWFKKHNPNNLSMVIINELGFKREEPKGTNNWVDDPEGMPDSILVGRRVFADWQKQHAAGNPVSLSDYSRDNKAKYAPEIHTSAGLKLAETRQKIFDEIKGLDTQIANKALQLGERMDNNSELHQLVVTKAVLVLVYKILGSVDCTQMDTLNNAQFALMDQFENLGSKRHLKNAVLEAIEIISKMQADLNNLDSPRSLIAEVEEFVALDFDAEGYPIVAPGEEAVAEEQLELAFNAEGMPIVTAADLTRPSPLTPKAQVVLDPVLLSSAQGRLEAELCDKEMGAPYKTLTDGKTIPSNSTLEVFAHNVKEAKKSLSNEFKMTAHAEVDKGLKQSTRTEKDSGTSLDAPSSDSNNQKSR